MSQTQPRSWFSTKPNPKTNTWTNQPPPPLKQQQSPRAPNQPAPPTAQSVPNGHYAPYHPPSFPAPAYYVPPVQLPNLNLQNSMNLNHNLLNSNASLASTFLFSSGITVKVFFGDEIKRLRLEETATISDLLQHVSRVSSVKNPQIHYKDDENEWISFNTEDEWQECLQLRFLQPRPYVKIKVIGSQSKKEVVKEESNEDAPPKVPSRTTNQPIVPHHNQVNPVPSPIVAPIQPFGNVNPDKPLPQEPVKEVKFVHTQICCDRCGMQPLVGNKYVCVTKDDYDLCENCFNNRKSFGMDTHTFDVFADDKSPAISRITPEKKVEPPQNSFAGYPDVNPILGSSFSDLANQLPKQPETNPEVQEPSVNPAFAKKLRLLYEMGFVDKKVNEQLLTKHKGNMQAVVKEHLKR